MSEHPAVFPPSADFVAKANVQGMDAYRALYDRAAENPEAFWGGLADTELAWFEKPATTLEWKPPFAKWFAGGKINASYNCLDRHLETQPDTVAFYFEGEPGDSEVITYRELHARVCRFANVLKSRGYKSGDRSVIYMPMIPQLPVAMLACARLGIMHSVVFGGFSAEALKARIQDLGATLVITADGGWRRGKEVKLKTAVDEALLECPGVRDVIAYQRTNTGTEMKEGRDHWWHDLEAGASDDCPAVPLDAEHPLFALYTSGTTGKPKGILHTTAGYLLQAKMTMHWIFDLKNHDRKGSGTASNNPAHQGGDTTSSTASINPAHQGGDTTSTIGLNPARQQGDPSANSSFDPRTSKLTDVYWCSADIGWVTGHTYVVYGPLAAGATSVIYEGAPDFPQWDRWWQIIAKYRVTIFYTSPTAIRALVKQGETWPNNHDLTSLRLLGSVGEPINPAAWEWYHRVIGKDRCPIVDTWWQTETGAIMIAPMPGAVPLKPGSGTLPLPGIIADIVDFEGRPVTEPNKEGFLIIRKPWPSMIRTIWGDPDRYHDQYWSRFPGIYFTGDAARRDADGYFWVLGRVDDVMNVSGHRLSTMEVESALVRHPAVAEAAVVGKPHEITGQAVCAFVTLKKGDFNHEALGKELRNWVAHEIGAFARPEEIRFAEALPKTRSGKIMRRLLREIVTSHTVAGDVTTLEDLSVVQALSAQHDED